VNWFRFVVARVGMDATITTTTTTTTAGPFHFIQAKAQNV
jgi:hypothetical protein